MTSTNRIPVSLKRAADTLRDAALAYPETREDFPWGEQAFKVRGHIFLFMSLSPQGLGLSVKLPSSHSVALMLPFVSPAGYGLGASGWVSVKFGPKHRAPLGMLRMWLEESYIAVAPRKLGSAVATLADQEQATPEPEASRPTRVAKPRRDTARRSKAAR